MNTRSQTERAKQQIVRLQKQVGVTSDGYWGNESQSALVESGKELGFDFDPMRQHFGRLSQQQVDGVNAILDACNGYARAPALTQSLGQKISQLLNRRKTTRVERTDAINPCYVAYAFATAWHETAHTLQPIREIGRGRGRPYGRYLDMNGRVYRGLKHLYYGRGYVQLTWLTNYVRMKKLLGIDLVNKPWLALRPEVATQIMLVGMLGGVFTGLSLSDCIKYGIYFEFVDARAIINGSDKDTLIADYAVDFLSCLEVV